MTKLVCQCLNREEFKSCLLFLRKNNIVWCSNEEIDVEKNLHELYDSISKNHASIECMYVFFHKKKEDEFMISYSIKPSPYYSPYNGIFASLKNGLNMIGKEAYYVVNLNTFIKTLTFYLETWN